MKRIGFAQNLRAGAWLACFTYQNMIGPQAKFTALHWAALCEGARRCWEEDPQLENTALRNTMKIGLRQCTVFSFATPDDAKRYMCDVGNSMNDQAEQITFIHIQASTEELDAAFADLRSRQGLTHGVVSQSIIDNKRIEHANTIFPGRFCSLRCLEEASTFFRGATSCVIDNEGKEMTSWSAYALWANAHVNVTHPQRSRSAC